MTGASETAAYFESMYADNGDPYALRTRWYEQRKRALLLAALPLPHYAHAFEPGCGAAELTGQLALRCDRLLASDFSSHAVARARQRFAEQPQVRIERHDLPHDWPTAQGPFDLIVWSEIGYFLDAAAMARVAAHCAETLADGGTLVACNWKPDFAERRLSTAAVHAALDGIGLPCLVWHEEDDFVLQLWSRDARSVAQREGIR